MKINPEKPTSWFNPLYSKSNAKGDGIPWAHMETHPHFKRWLTQHSLQSKQGHALVVGCGLGDDAIELENRGFKVTAFDVSEKAIEFCLKRFPLSSVKFEVADLFADLSHWKNQFDFVLEIYTIQALPPKYESEVISKVRGFLAPEGILLVIALVSDEERALEKGPPWELTSAHRQSFLDTGLSLIHSDEIKRDNGGFVYISTFKG